MNAMVVMEQYSELDLLLDAARRLGVRPSIGIRAKLTTRHNGHWGSTSGDKAKVGAGGLAGGCRNGSMVAAQVLAQAFGAGPRVGGYGVGQKGVAGSRQGSGAGQLPTCRLFLSLL